MRRRFFKIRSLEYYIRKVKVDASKKEWVSEVKRKDGKETNDTLFKPETDDSINKIVIAKDLKEISENVKQNLDPENMEGEQALVFKDVIRENWKKLNNVGIEDLNPVTPKPEILPYIDFSGPQSGECPVSTERTQPLVKWPEIKKKSGFEKVDLRRVAVGHSSYQGQSVLQRNPQRLHSLRARHGVRVQSLHLEAQLRCLRLGEGCYEGLRGPLHSHSHHLRSLWQRERSQGNQGLCQKRFQQRF